VKAEIIAVGTELLMGQVVNSNATFISEQLNTLGIDVYYHTVVGDNPERLEQLLQLADTRSDLIVLCGGLGPTDDDLTKQTVAAHVHEPLVENAAGKEILINFFAKLARPMTPNNIRQIEVIHNSRILKNRTGLALGCLYHNDTANYLLLPGPPNELIPMFREQANPLLAEVFHPDAKLVSRVLRFYGIGESQLATDLADLIKAQTNPTIAPYAKTNEVTLRITANSDTEEQGNALLDDLEKTILSRVGEFFYGYGDDNSLEEVVVHLLKEKNQSITAAESLTAGLFQATIGNVSGVSEVFPGGFVTYSADTKMGFLGIDAELIEKYGVVSEECARAMAEKARLIVGTDYALSFTGVAGPNALEGKEAGTVFIALASRHAETEVVEFHFPRDRSYVRQSAVMRALGMLRQALLKV
jgi:nicotinamide-nucleotide amidase